MASRLNNLVASLAIFGREIVDNCVFTASQHASLYVVIDAGSDRLSTVFTPEQIISFAARTPALRELQAVTDAAPEGQWCWDTQAAEELTAIQAGGASGDQRGRNGVESAAQVRLYHSVVLARPLPNSGC